MILNKTAPRQSRLLVVDDTASGRATVEAALAREGYEIAQAASGPECLDKVQSFDPDLILLDVMMPGMDGFEVCRLLREQPRQRSIPIVMVTALADTDSMVRGLEAGADDFLGKPFNKWELRARVSALVRLGVQQRANAEHDRFFWAVEHANDGFVLLDRMDRVLHCNAAARRYLGFGADDPIGGLFIERLARDSMPEPSDAWERWGSSEGRGLPFHLVRTVPGGHFREWVLVTPHQHPDDPDGMVIVSLRDVTHEVERQMRQFEFHELVSHKLRTPLTGIVGAVDRLASARAQLPGERERQMLDIVVNSTNRLNEAVQDVLGFVEDGASREVPMSLSRLVLLVRDAAAAQNVVAIAMQVAPGMPDTKIPLGEVSMQVILRELMQNARRFHPKGRPSVTVRLAMTGSDGVRIEVEDDGLHLTPRQLQRALEPYVQGDPALTGEVPGMGLGLSLVALRVRGAGGRCRIENRQDQPGVCVRLDLPLGEK